VKLYLLPLLAVACSPAPVPVPPEPVPPPPPVEDAGADVDDGGPGEVTANCLAAEETLCRLDCKTPDGISLCVGPGPDAVRFAARCRSEIAKGIPWDHECLATVKRCEDFNAAATGELCADGGAK
jgi:hypothetical protein